MMKLTLCLSIALSLRTVEGAISHTVDSPGFIQPASKLHYAKLKLSTKRAMWKMTDSHFVDLGHVKGSAVNPQQQVLEAAVNMAKQWKNSENKEAAKRARKVLARLKEYLDNNEGPRPE